MSASQHRGEQATRSGRPLTRRGLATRDKIVAAAAELIYQHGVKETTNEAIRRAAGVSGSQLSHFFPDKEMLVRAVIAWRADKILVLHQVPGLGQLDSFAALRLWADSYIEREEICRGGCSYGSLAGEIIKTHPDMREDISDGFERWEELFRRGLRAMRERGQLVSEADPDQLAYQLMAAFQGGMLLTQANGNVEPLRAALNGTLAHIESFSAERHR
jgi:TetR/AcrR family transcriptional repressor of nem operon